MIKQKLDLVDAPKVIVASPLKITRQIDFPYSYSIHINSHSSLRQAICLVLLPRRTICQPPN